MTKVAKVFLWCAATVVVFLVLDFAISEAMLRGTKHYYGLDRDSKVLLLGHSHLMLAADKEEIENETGLTVSKYCREGVGVADRAMMADHFLHSGCADSLRFVLYGVDLCTFNGSGLSMNSHKLFYPFMDDSPVDSYIHEKDSPSDYWTRKLVRTSRYNDDGMKNAVWRGWASDWSNFKTKTVDTVAYKMWVDAGRERKIEINPKLVETFRQTVGKFTSRGVKVVFVNTPTLYILNRQEPERYEEVMQIYRDFADRDSLVEFWDFNPSYEHRTELFNDRLHLNARGQREITAELVKRINAVK